MPSHTGGAGIVRLRMIEPRKTVVLCLGIAGLLAASGCACQRCATTEEPPTTAAAEPEPIEVHQWDRWRIAGQPMPADYDRQAKAGTTMVINLRTQPEIDRLDFDPRQQVESRGMEYVAIPMGGDEGYTPEQLEAFTQAIDGVDGPILIHCASGGRARYLWAAYFVEEQSIPLNEAMLRMQEVGGQPALMERLLGHRFHYTIGEPLPEPEADQP